MDILSKEQMKISEWLACGRPAGVWIDLGPKEAPDKYPNIVGTRYDQEHDIIIFPAIDGSDVIGIMRPHPLIDDVTD